MKIVSLKIKNFRGYKDLTEIKFDNLTVFVGKNDIGKSTILEALDIFFESLSNFFIIFRDSLYISILEKLALTVNLSGA